MFPGCSTHVARWMALPPILNQRSPRNSHAARGGKVSAHNIPPKDKRLVAGVPPTHHGFECTSYLLHAPLPFTVVTSLPPPPPRQRYVNHTINGSPNDTDCPRRTCRTERKAPLAVSSAL